MNHRYFLFLSALICVHLRLISLAAAPVSVERHGPYEPKVDGVIGLPMYHDPTLTPPASSVTFNPRLKVLWLAALKRPDASLRRQAADAFATAAQEGMTDLQDVIEPLVRVLKNDRDQQVRLAAAHALDAINDPQAAPAMFAADKAAGHYEMILAIDPALARWKYQPAYAVWRKRASADMPTQVGMPVRISAIHALATVDDPEASAPLLKVAMDKQAPPPVRLAAGRALGRLSHVASVGEADSLTQGDLTDRLVIASILASQSARAVSQPAAAQAQTVLLSLATDKAPTVAASALESLNKIDTAIVAAKANQFIDHPDPEARRAVVEALAAQPSAQAVQLLAGRLDDASTAVRDLARGALAKFAKQSSLDSNVRQATMAVLTHASEGWRGLEQAALLLGSLDHKPAADRLLALLDHDRPEVRLAATTALRELAVPATLPALLERAKVITKQVKSAPAGKPVAGAGDETTQIFMTFGQLLYQPAQALMRTYIPKNSGFASPARAAAIYALGKLHEGQLDAKLARTLAGRLSDINPMNPEATDVRRFSAIALGRMSAKAQLSVLRRFYKEENGAADIGGACRWAIIRITGQPLPPLTPNVSSKTGWFLEPTGS